MLRSAATRILSRSTVATRRFSTDLEANAPTDAAFIEAWKKIAPNIDPPKTPLAFIKPRPPTPSSIPSKLTLNFVLPYSSELASKEGLLGPTGIGGLIRRYQTNNCIVNYRSPYHLTRTNTADPAMSTFSRAFASQTSKGKESSKREKEISTVEDPFDAPTYNIPQKPVTFTEGASYSLIIFAGLGIAAAAAYGVFSELIFSPKEYKVFGIALKRVQNDSQVSVRIGSPVTGYGQDSRNRAARQRIPHRIWTDEDGVEHVEVNFFVRGPHGYGKVYTEMFKDKEENKWKFTYMIVDIDSPSKAQLMLESYIPGVAA